MLSKRRYKICICSVILAELESFRNYKGSFFPENFRCNLKFYESKNFSDSPLHGIFESENFRFPFFTKNSLTWELQCGKLYFRKSWEFIRYASKIVHEWNGDLETVSRPRVSENSRQFLLLRTDTLQKTVVRCSWYFFTETYLD